MGYDKNDKSERSKFEKTLLKLMIDMEVDQTDIALFEGVSPQAINNRLKRLNQKKMEKFKILITVVAEQKRKNGKFSG